MGSAGNSICNELAVGNVKSATGNINGSAILSVTIGKRQTGQRDGSVVHDTHDAGFKIAVDRDGLSLGVDGEVFVDDDLRTVELDRLPRQGSGEGDGGAKAACPGVLDRFAQRDFVVSGIDNIIKRRYDRRACFNILIVVSVPASASSVDSACTRYKRSSDQNAEKKR